MQLFFNHTFKVKMSATTATSTISNSCAFCRANQQPYAHPLKNSVGAVVCKQLLAYTCPYCKEKGHTTKHCPRLAQKKQREQQEAERRQVREEEETKKKVETAAFKANCWASVAAKGIPSSVSQQIEEEERAFKEKQSALQKKRAEEERVKKQKRQEEWEQNYPVRMGRKYGEFWSFYTEGTQDDHEIANQLRSKEDLQERFRDSLFAKYGFNWYNKCEDTDDNCPYVGRYRYLRECEEEEWEWHEMEREKQEMARVDEKFRQMDEKLKKGEITYAQYNDWLFRGDSDDESVHENQMEFGENWEA